MSLKNVMIVLMFLKDSFIGWQPCVGLYLAMYQNLSFNSCFVGDNEANTRHVSVSIPTSKDETATPCLPQ